MNESSEETQSLQQCVVNFQCKFHGIVSLEKSKLTFDFYFHFASIKCLYRKIFPICNQINKFNSEENNNFR